MIETKRLIDEDTGEILNEIKKRKSFVVFDADGYAFGAKKYYRKSFNDIKLSDVIGDGEDFHRIHLLSEMLYKDTNCLMIRESERKVRAMNVDDIAKVVKLCGRNAKEFVDKMIEKHVMAERRDTVGEETTTKYYLNPLFWYCSKRISPDLYFLFQESLNCYLPLWAIRKYHEVGNIKCDKIVSACWNC